MHVGIAIPDTGTVDVTQLARRAEALGFESLWVPEHTVYPVRDDDRALPPGQLPDMARYADPFVTLAACAAVTERIRLGTGVCLVPQRHPLETAKAVASLDRLSGGRVLFGVGAGWLEPEAALFGVDFPRRWTQTRDYILAMKAWWGAERAHYSGAYAKFGDVWRYPAPVQQPHPPVLVAGVQDGVVSRVAEYGDGWIPVQFRIQPDALATRRGEIEAAMRERGRDPASLTVTLYSAKPDAGQNRDYAQAGADRVVHFLPTGDTAAQQAVLERYADTLLG